MKKITANLVLTPNGFEKGVVITLDDNSVIAKMEYNVENIDSISGLEYYNGVIIPGMVNSHSHIEYSYVKGLIPQGGGLPEFIRSIIGIKIKNEIPDSVKKEQASIWDKKLYEQGVVAVADHNNNDYVHEMKSSSSVYYHDLIELFDVDNQTADETFSQGIKRMEHSRSLGLGATVIPHACYTMEDRLIALTGGEVVSNDGIKATGVFSTHFKESVDLGGEKETSRIIDNVSKDRSSVIFVHCIYAKEEDLKPAMDKFGDKLTICSCPMSNLYIENKIGDFDLFRRLGIRMVLGTDSLSSNTMLSMVDEMKCLSRNYPNIPTEEIISMATINGAKAIEIDSWAGTIEEGKRPGLVLLEGMDLMKIKFTENTTSRRLI